MKKPEVLQNIEHEGAQNTRRGKNAHHRKRGGSRTEGNGSQVKRRKQYHFQIRGPRIRHYDGFGSTV